MMFDGGIRMFSVHSERKYDPTHETVTVFLYNTMKTATHSFFNRLLLGNWPTDCKSNGAVSCVGSMYGLTW